jgi:thiol-disulfide isomerase/thioredoxin
MTARTAFVVTLAVMFLGLPEMTLSQKYRWGIIGQRAPEWGVTEWYNLPDGRESLGLADFRGKVVYLFGFQSWCPGCHAHGFPTLKEVSEHFVASDDVAFVAVQTVFEGFGANTSEKALATVQSFDLDIPVGHDTGSDNRHSTLMARYRSGGTPWTIIIDRDGIVQFNGFQIESKEAIRLIDRLLDDSPSDS